jgi:hypothetical protein
MSKRPKCASVITSATINDVDIANWRGISYCCPYCSTILSVSIDPVALKTDTIAAIARELAPIHQQLATLNHNIGQIAVRLAQR